MFVDELDPIDCHGVLDVFAEQHRCMNDSKTLYVDEHDSSVPDQMVMVCLGRGILWCLSI